LIQAVAPIGYVSPSRATAVSTGVCDPSPAGYELARQF
jgi:hypothetical protein